MHWKPMNTFLYALKTFFICIENQWIGNWWETFLFIENRWIRKIFQNFFYMHWKPMNRKYKKNAANCLSQLLPGCMEVHCLQCKNCQYRYLWQYPSEMSNFFFLTSIYQTGLLPKEFIIVRSPDQSSFNTWWFLLLKRCE